MQMKRFARRRSWQTQRLKSNAHIFHRLYLALPTGENNKADALGVMKAPTLGGKSGRLAEQCTGEIVSAGLAD